MIVGIGVDIVSNDRFKDKPIGFLEKLFTKNELELSLSHPSPSEYYASRFAAKEAFVKALGTGFVGLMPTDIEIYENESGKPFIRALKSTGIDGSVHLSISHERDSSVAMVVIEDGKK